MTDWVEEFEGAVTVCDEEGVIVALNRKAGKMFAKDGGAGLVGSSVLGCHPQHARETIQRLLEERTSNVYSIEQRGRRRLIYQSPWYRNGRYAGLLELSLDLPPQMRNLARD